MAEVRPELFGLTVSQHDRSKTWDIPAYSITKWQK